MAGHRYFYGTCSSKVASRHTGHTTTIKELD